MERRRGIRSLIPTGTLAEPAETIQEVLVDRLGPSPFQPRRQLDQEALVELAESVKTHGILQPLVVRKAGSELQVIAGERRLQAARLAGLQRVPVVIREASDREMLELALVENLQREDINPLEAAEAYQRLMGEFGLTQDQVGERVGKSRSAVANALRLLGLPGPIRESLRQGQIEEGHGKVLASLPNEKLALRLWRRVVQRGLSVRETEAAAAQLGGQDVPRGTFLGRPKKVVRLDPNLQYLQDRMTERLGSRIRFKPKRRGKGGVIEIAYVDYDDLDRLFTYIMTR